MRRRHVVEQRFGNLPFSAGLVLATDLVDQSGEAEAAGKFFSFTQAHQYRAADYRFGADEIEIGTRHTRIFGEP